MKIVSLSIILTLILNQVALADCDFSKGITEVTGGYLYTKECHQKVGKMTEDLKDREVQVEKLTKSIELKDLSIQFNEKRADMWLNTSSKLEDRLNTIERFNATTNFLFFGLGMVFMGAAVWSAAQIK